MAVRHSIAASSVTPELRVGIAPDGDGALPGEEFTHAIEVRNFGALLSISGTLRAENYTTSSETISDYHDYVEYYSTSESRWVPLGGVQAGFTVPSAPIRTGMTFRTTSVPRDRVRYPTAGDPIRDTFVNTGAEAEWRYEAEVVLDATMAERLATPGEVQAIRNVIGLRFFTNTSGQAGNVRRVMGFTKQLQTQSGELQGVRVEAALADGATHVFNDANTPALRSLRPGHTATLSVTDRVPTVAARGPLESDAAYLARLRAARESAVAVNLTATGTVDGEASESPEESGSDLAYELIDESQPVGQVIDLILAGEASALEGPARQRSGNGSGAVEVNLPIVAIDKSGPQNVVPNELVSYSIGLVNEGDATATVGDVSDRLADGERVPVEAPPATLTPGQASTVVARHRVDRAQVPGDLSDTAEVRWLDARGNAYGPLSASFVTNVGEGAQIEIGANETALTPRLEATITPDRASALPGESVAYRTDIANTGAAFELEGTLSAINRLEETASIAAYHVALERLDAETRRWEPVAVAASARSGYTPRVAAPTAKALEIDAYPQGFGEAVYPADGDRVLATELAPDKRAAWSIAARATLATTDVQALVDPARTLDVRLRSRVELTGQEGALSGQTSAAQISAEMHSQTAEAREVQVDVSVPGSQTRSFNQDSTPRLGRLRPGDSVLLDVESPLPVPASKSSTESDLDYIERLAAADRSGLAATAAVRSIAGGRAARAADGAVSVAPDRRLPDIVGKRMVSERLPVVSLVKTGPEAALPGDATTYRFALVNTGSEPAAIDALTDSIDGAPAAGVPGVPATVAAGATHEVTWTTSVPANRAPGQLRDRAELRWSDAAGNVYGPVSDSWSVRVMPPVSIAAPTLSDTGATLLADATSFLYTGSNPIQSGVPAGAIDPVRAAVLRGRVTGRDGAALAGVDVSVVDHPQFGRTTTQPDGQFYLAVNGGGPLTVRFERSGYLPADRRVDVPWGDYAFVDDAVLVPLDPVVRQVDLSSALSPVQVVQGSPVSDLDGQRQATLIFQPGTQATMTLPDGTTSPLAHLSVRATEYTVGPNGPEAMPAPLPPMSGYTYAVEFSVDEAIAAGASEVRFTRPVANYTENFLGFPVGSAVPTGYYDRDRAQWVAAPNGRVVGILAEQDGRAVLDVDGSGQPATTTDLDALAVTSAEQARLAAIYEPGDSLWRVQIEHFTPWDHNWPFGLPPGAFSPDGRLRPGFLDDCNQCEGSVLEAENQVLGEDLTVPGVPQTLHYRSDRVPGRTAERSIEIPLSDADVPASAKRIELDVEIGGRAFHRDFAPAPGLTHRFSWDGMDAFGREVNGGQRAAISVSYVFDAVGYSEPADTAASFALGGGAVTTDRARGEISLVQSFGPTLGGLRPAPKDLGGWTLNEHHRYDPGARVLYNGDGSRRSAEGIVKGFDIAAGSYNLDGFDGDGGPAGQSLLRRPSATAVHPDGSLYIADTRNSRIRRVGRDGVITTIAGNGSPAASGDGGPAIQAGMTPHDLAIAPDGSIYFTDCGAASVRRIAPNGTIERIAGGGSGLDRVPATEADLGCPAAIALAPDGSVLFSDYYNYNIRRIGTDGILTTVAGWNRVDDFRFGSSGDGGPATEAALSGPTGLAIGRDGSIYIADYVAGRVRRVGTDGVIETVAGTDRSDGPRGDGGLATEAHLGGVGDVAVSPDETLYITEVDHGTVRAVDPDGIITTLAGVPTSERFDEPFPDRGSPAQMKIDTADGITLAPDGTLYVAAYWNSVVFRIRAELPGVNVGETLIPSEDGSEAYVFTRAGRHLRTHDPLTGTTIRSFDYDSHGRLLTITDQFGNVTTVERAADGSATAIVGPFGHINPVTLTSADFLGSIADPAGATTRFSYDSGGLLRSMTRPSGSRWLFEHDSEGRIVTDTSPDGSVKTLTRTTEGSERSVAVETAGGFESHFSVKALPGNQQVRIATDPTGRSRRETSGPDGKRKVTDPDGATHTTTVGADPRFGTMVPLIAEQVTRTPSGRTRRLTRERTARLANSAAPLSLQALEERIDVNGRVTTAAYDASLGRLTTRSPAGRTSVTDLDANGRIITSRAPASEPIGFRYDPRGLLAEAGALGRRTVFGRGSRGELTAVRDPLGRTQRLAYDDAGRVLSYTDTAGAQTAFAYHADGQLKMVAPPGRGAHTFGYTATGSRSLYQPPSVDSTEDRTRFEYGSDGVLRHTIDPDNRRVEYTFDARERLTSLRQPHGTTTFGYDVDTGRLVSLSGPGGEGLTLAYDGDLIVGEGATGTVHAEVSRTYDDHFRMTSETAGGETAAYRYDEDGLLIVAGAMSLTRDAEGGQLSSSNLDQLTTTYEWTTFHELSHIDVARGGTAVLSADYTRDSLGRLASVTEAVDGDRHTWRYDYDPAGRLARATKDGAAYAAYTYDANGNRTSVAYAGQPVHFGVYDAQDRLTRLGPVEFQYNRSGQLMLRQNTASGEETRYVYDTADNLRSVHLPDGTAVDYVADPYDRRIGVKVNGQIRERFVWGEADNPIAELDADGNLRSRFVYGTSLVVPDYMLRHARRYALVTDQLGSVRLVVDTQTGEVAQKLDYDPYGRVLTDTNPGFQPFGFAGGLYDHLTGLVRFGTRDYDPDTGRFTTKDPLDFAGGDTNLYAYALGDPLNIVDPTGLFWQELSDAAAGFGDAITLGGTSEIRKAFGIDNVDRNSFYYKGGSVAGDVYPTGKLRLAGRAKDWGGDWGQRAFAAKRKNRHWERKFEFKLREQGLDPAECKDWRKFFHEYKDDLGAGSADDLTEDEIKEIVHAYVATKRHGNRPT